MKRVKIRKLMTGCVCLWNVSAFKVGGTREGETTGKQHLRRSESLIAGLCFTCKIGDCKSKIYEPTTLQSRACGTVLCCSKAALPGIRRGKGEQNVKWKLRKRTIILHTHFAHKIFRYHFLSFRQIIQCRQ